MSSLRATDLRASRPDARGARVRLRARHALGVAPRAGRASRPAPSTPAVAANVIERDDETWSGSRIRCSHRSCYRRPRRRRGGAFTRASLQSSTTRFVRARHLALSRDVPDAAVARDLDAAAALAADRGASAARGRARGAAHRLTPPDDRDERHRRALAAARAHQAAGRVDACAGARDRPARPRRDIGSLARRGARPPRRAREPRSCGRRCSRRRCARPASRPALQSVDPLPPRVGDALQEGLSAGARPRPHRPSSSPTSSTTTRFERACPRGAGDSRLVRGDAGRADDLPARAQDFTAAVGGEQLVQEATLGPRQHASRRRRREDEARARCSNASTTSGGSATSRGAPARSGGSPGSSSGRAAGSSRPRTLPAPTTSRSSTGTRCRRIISRSPSIAVHRGQLELAREHSERGPRRWPTSSSALHPPQHLAVLGLVALWSGDLPRRRSGSPRPTRQAAELGWGEPSVALVDRRPRRAAARARPRRRRRRACSTSGRQTRPRRTANGCSRT